MGHVPTLKQEREIDFVIANGENAAAGRGITPKIAIDLLRSGIAVITSGDHIWDQKEIIDYLPTEPRMLRPLNYEDGTPGAGSVVLETAKGKVAVINAQGRTFMNPPLENPFTRIEEEVTRLRDDEGVRVIFVDFHAETTSESIAMGYHLDGLVSAVVGTHTHVQTADERDGAHVDRAAGVEVQRAGAQVRPLGHLVIDELACSCRNIGGVDYFSVVWRFKTGMPTRFPVAKGQVRLCGVVVDVDEQTGMALAVERYNELLPLGS